MNSGYRLSKDRHDCRVRCISPWKLHVVGELVWWNALQNQLTGISVFAFVALERNSQKPNPDCDDHGEDCEPNNPPPDMPVLLSVNGSISH